MVESKCLEEIDLKEAAVDLWLKEIAPYPECYKCLDENPTSFDEFKEKYWC